MRDAELVEFVARQTRRARVVLTGTSMEPLLRAGMVVDIEPLDGPPRRGDVLVFRSQRGLVAHRLVGGELLSAGAHNMLHVRRTLDSQRGTFRTAGDAHPDRVERVRAEHVVGRVCAVWSSAAPDAVRVDDARHRRLGKRIARTQAVRSIAARVRAYAAVTAAMLTADAARDTSPVFAALTAATQAFERGDAVRGVALLAALPRPRALELTRRHHLGGLVSRWLDDAARAGIDVPPDLREPYRRIRLANALQAARVLDCVRDVRDRLTAAGIPLVFLKGGARLAAGVPDADLQFAGDVDALVPANEAARALAVLRAAGYGDVQTPAWRAGHAAWLHHGEPLVAPAIGVPVEIHHSLVPPALVNQRLDYAALAPAAQTVYGPIGAVRVFDEVTAAVHLAYHARDLAVWRDIVLLARLLRRFDDAARARFDGWIAGERRDGLRLRSAVAAADAFETEPRAMSPAVRRYLAWVNVREDLPARFGSPDLAEALLGRCRIAKLSLHSRHDVGLWLRCWLRNLALLPMLVRRTRSRP